MSTLCEFFLLSWAYEGDVQIYIFERYSLIGTALQLELCTRCSSLLAQSWQNLIWACETLVWHLKRYHLGCRRLHTKPKCIAVLFFERMALAHLGFLLFLLDAVIVLSDNCYLWCIVGSLCVCVELKEEIFILGYFRLWFHGHSIQHMYN